MTESASGANQRTHFFIQTGGQQVIKQNLSLSPSPYLASGLGCRFFNKASAAMESPLPGQWPWLPLLQQSHCSQGSCHIFCAGITCIVSSRNPWEGRDPSLEHGHSHWERHGVAGKVLEERMRRASSRQAAFILKVLEEQNRKALKHQSFLTYHEPLARLHPQLLPWQHGRRQLFGATLLRICVDSSNALAEIAKGTRRTFHLRQSQGINFPLGHSVDPLIVRQRQRRRTPPSNAKLVSIGHMLVDPCVLGLLFACHALGGGNLQLLQPVL